MATDLEQLVLTISADTRQIQRAMKKLEGDTGKSLTAVERTTTRSVQGIEKSFTRTGNVIQGQTGNIAAQFQDIAVQLQSGQSPFTIALQQGTQLGAVLGQAGGGLGGTVRALAGAFASVVSPVNLLTIGLIAAGGAAIQYFTSGDEADALTETLKKHSDVIRDLKSAYGESAKGLEEILAVSQAVADGTARRQQESLKAQIDTFARTAVEDVRNELRRLQLAFEEGGAALKLPGVGDTTGVTLLGDAVIALQRSIEAGRPDIESFRAALDAIAQRTDVSDFIRGLADELFESGGKADEAQRRLGALQGGIASLGEAALANARNISVLSGALRNLSQLSSISLGEDAIAEVQRRVGRAAAQTREEIDDVEAAYSAAMARIKAQSAPRPQGKPNLLDFDPNAVPRGGGGGRRRGGGGGAAKTDEFAAWVKSLEEQTTALQNQMQAMDAYGLSLQEAQQYAAGLTAAQKDGTAATDSERAKILEIAEAYGAAQDAAKDYAEAQSEAQKAAAQFADLGKSVLSGFISDLREGKSAAEAFRNALDKIIDSLINMAINNLFANFGGGGFGGFLSSLFGRAAGGHVTSGQPYMVGERGPEVFVPNTSGKIMSRAGGSDTSVVVNNFSGAQARTSETLDSRGRRRIEVTIGEAVAKEVRRAGSAPYNAMRGQFGLTPALVGR